LSKPDDELDPEKHLILKAPNTLGKAPESYSFSRDRIANLDWEEIYTPEQDTADTENESDSSFDAQDLLKYFKKKWGASGDSVSELLDIHILKIVSPGSYGPELPDPWPVFESIDVVPDKLKTRMNGVMVCLPNLENVETKYKVSDPDDSDNPSTNKNKDLLRRPARLKIMDDSGFQEDNFEFLPSSRVAFKVVAGNPTNDNGNDNIRYYLPFSLDETTWEKTYLPYNDVLDAGTLEKLFKKINGVEMAFGTLVDSGELPNEPHLLPQYWSEFNSQLSSDELKVKAAKHAADGFTFIDDFRADAALIIRQWEALEAEKQVAEKMADAAENLLSAENLADDSSLESWRTRSERYFGLVQPSWDVRPKQMQLVDAASELGYRLFLENKEIRVRRDGANPLVIKCEKGELYLEETRVTSWTTSHRVKKKRRSLFGSRSKKYTVYRNHSKTYRHFRRVSKAVDGKMDAVDYDPWVEGVATYENLDDEGLGMDVHLMIEQYDGGLSTRDGTTLSQIMKRCEREEAYRRKCAVAFPLYEVTITGRRLLAGYRFYIRPCKGITINDDPDVSLKEQLSYRFVWNGTRLGELATSIPLAPGEEREVTITVNESTESSSSQSAKSLTELTTVEKRDFESTFEREVTKENRKNSSSNVSGGAPIGGGTVSGGFSKGASSKTVARTLNRAVKRSAREVSRKAKTETEITVGRKTTISTTNSTTHRIRNINEGGTLNLNLYRVLNEYLSGLFLEDLEFKVFAGPALIEGTEYRETFTFNPRESLSDFLDYIHLNTPFDPPPDSRGVTNWDKSDCKLLKQLYDIILSEYTPETVVSESKSLIEKFWPKLNSDDPESTDVKCWKEWFEEELPTKFENNAIFDVVEFTFDSGALYIDSLMGRVSATEDFANKMRLLEVEGKAAENGLVRARTRTILDPNRHDLNNSIDYVTSARFSKSTNTISLLFSSPNIASYDWLLFLDGEEVHVESIDLDLDVIDYKLQGNTYEYLGRWNDPEFHASLVLVNSVSGVRLPYRYR